MRRMMMAITIIGCLTVIALSTFTSSYMQLIESARIKNGKTDTITQSDDSPEPQTFNSDIQQASRSSAMWNINKVDDAGKIQDEQTLSKHELIVLPTETNQSQILDPPAPLPDGRIFLRSSAGTEDPIPYIPTENPKATSRTPVVPPELDI